MQLLNYNNKLFKIYSDYLQILLTALPSLRPTWGETGKVQGEKTASFWE